LSLPTTTSKINYMTNQTNAKKPNLICLILLISFPSFTTVFISPALPVIGSYLAISASLTQQLITVFVIGYAFGQLLYSPFANRFGRKPTIYLGVGIFIVSSIICIFAVYCRDIDVMIWCRFFMALGAAVGMIISFTMISDVYSPQDARRAISYTVLAYAFMPAIGIAIGGFITTHLSWVVCFYFNVIYGLFILFISFLLPETLQQKNHHALKLKPLLQSYRAAFTNQQLLAFSFIYGLMASFIYIVASGAPFIGIDTIGLTPADYGALLLIPYSGQFLGALVAGRFSAKFTPYQAMFIGYSSTVFGCLLMFVTFLCGWVNPFSLFAPIFFIMMGLPMTYSTVTVMALKKFPDKATGSAIMSFITMLTALVFSFILTLLPAKKPLMMPSVEIVVCVIAITMFVYVKRRYAKDT